MKGSQRIASFVLFFLSLTVAYAGGWPQKKGKGYFKLSQSILRADRYFNPEGMSIKIQPGISLYTTALYGEYGITDRLTLVGYIPFFTRAVQNNLERRNGEFVEGTALNSFGDTDIGIKYGLITDKSIVMSATLSLGIPFGNTGGEDTNFLQTGDGEFNQRLIVDISKSFYPLPMYANIMVGANNRTNGFSEEFHFGAELGYTYRKITAIMRVQGVESFRNGLTADNTQQSVFGNNVEFFSLLPELIYEFKKDKAGVSATYMTALSGSQILASPAYSMGLNFKI
jgi:hypothetical protein